MPARRRSTCGPSGARPVESGASCSCGGPASSSASLILLVWIVCADRRRPHHAVPAAGAASSQPFLRPNSTNWMGTDQLGRDVLSRVMAGARDVLIAAPIAAMISVVAGSLLGLLMGYYRGWIDEIFSRIVEALLSIPVYLMGILIVTSLGIVADHRHRHGRAAVHADRHPYRAGGRDRRGPARLRRVGQAARRVRAVRDDPGDPAQHQRADRRRAHRARRVRRVHDRHALVPRVRPPAARRPTGACRSPRRTRYIQSGYWWPAIFPALAIASLVFATTLVADSIEAVLAA